MGYTTTTNSIFPPDMPQTPENVRKVLDIAGWTNQEAADACGVTAFYIASSINGFSKMRDGIWKILLEQTGKRSFDHDGESL